MALGLLASEAVALELSFASPDWLVAADTNTGVIARMASSRIQATTTCNR
jgi:hypothetical protein